MNFFINSIPRVSNYQLYMCIYIDGLFTTLCGHLIFAFNSSWSSASSSNSSILASFSSLFWFIRSCSKHNSSRSKYIHISVSLKSVYHGMPLSNWRFSVCKSVPSTNYAPLSSASVNVFFYAFSPHSALPIEIHSILSRHFHFLPILYIRWNSKVITSRVFFRLHKEQESVHRKNNPPRISTETKLQSSVCILNFF